MSTSIEQNPFEKQLEMMVQNFVKEKLETIMREEMSSFFTYEHPELKNYKNGFYTRQLDTKYGRIVDLQVPRDRDNTFQTTGYLVPINVVNNGSEKRSSPCIRKG